MLENLIYEGSCIYIYIERWNKKPSLFLPSEKPLKTLYM